MRGTLASVMVAVLAVTAAFSAHAQAPAAAGQLGRELTPVGAERAGNAAGTIPAWSGGLTAPPAGWRPEMGYIDPFPEDVALFTITRENWTNHQEQLMPGLVALLQKLIQQMDADLGVTGEGPGVRPPGRVAHPQPLLKRAGTEYD